MFTYLHYKGKEPLWAKDIRTSIPAYSPSYTFIQQEKDLAPILANKFPSAYLNSVKIPFQLKETLWKPLSETLETLIEADRLTSTELLVWRDQWLLSRADAVVVENGASMDIPILAFLWHIPVISVSYTCTGMNHWLAKSSHITVNSPENGSILLSLLGYKG